MGRLRNTIPSLYYGKGNNLLDFVDVLDVEFAGIEKSIKGITDLINVDKCPDDKLPYLAAQTNCPLIGDDPVFWRKQIKNWPHILRLKGTKKSLAIVLDSIDAKSWNINTYFRDANGKYVTEKPVGNPFKDEEGIWHNIRTHYFSVDFTLTEDYVKSQEYAWNADELKEKLSFWLDRGKPFHAELLNIIVFPPRLIPEDHICYWDLCNWEHVEIKNYDWGLFEVAPSISVDARSEFFRAINVDSDTQILDTSTWGGMPYKLLLSGREFNTSFFAELNRGYTATWNIPYKWGYFSWSNLERYSREFYEITQRDYELDFDIKDSLQSFGSEYFIGFSARLQPYWDFRPWAKNITWGHNMGIPHILPGQQSDFQANVQWDQAEAPRAKWSKNRTWASGKNWRYAPTVAGTCEGGIWKYEEGIA